MIALIIPITGLLEVIDSNDPIAPEPELTRRGNTGHLVAVNLTKDHDPVGTVHFHVGMEENERAREAIVTLTGTHIVVQGCAMFTGIPIDLMREIVYNLSRKE